MSGKECKSESKPVSSFLDVVEEIRELHLRKSKDYGNSKTGDPLANLRAAARFGVDPWLGAVVRLNDKITRIESFVTNGKLANESLQDSLMDIAVYGILALILFREKLAQEKPEDQQTQAQPQEPDDGLQKTIRELLEAQRRYPGSIMPAHSCRGT